MPLRLFDEGFLNIQQIDFHINIKNIIKLDYQIPNKIKNK